MISSLNKPFKILGKGDVKSAFTVLAGSENISKSAREKIEKAGGKVEPRPVKVQPDQVSGKEQPQEKK